MTPLLYQELADAAFPNISTDTATIETRYPARTLPPEAKVTRFAPSPTGFMHIGGIYSGLISERIAHQSGGIFVLRIEDTDKAREIPGAVDLISNSLKAHNILIDEGEIEPGKETGAYGPYRQSARRDLYNVFAKYLLATGKAYLCFCTGEELEAQSKKQVDAKIRPGYRGEWAPCRTLEPADVLELLQSRKPFAVRLKSHGMFENHVALSDLIKGKLSLSENDIDAVLIKSDGFPTYHFAHVVDDRLMRTTDVLRGDEWLSSTPLHLQLWAALGWPSPRYGHIAPIMKQDGESKRKLSKRHDPEANVAYYEERGYPAEGVVDYLLNLANSAFETWRKANPTADYQNFPFDTAKLNKSGALFDEIKLRNVCRDSVATLSLATRTERILSWAKKHDAPLFAELAKDAAYTQKVIGIEEGLARKDLSCWSDVRSSWAFFFDNLFTQNPTALTEVTTATGKDDAKKFLEAMPALFTAAESTEDWLTRVRTLVTEMGYASGTKEFKANPSGFKGHIGHLTQVVRVALTGATRSPDLYTVMKVLGAERVTERCRKAQI